MTTFNPTRNARLDFRLSPRHRRIIERAASLTGQSISDFAVTSLVHAAQSTLERAAVTQLTARDRDRFLKLIDSDAKPNKALRAAARNYRKNRG